MSFLANGDTRLLVQGATGQLGRRAIQIMNAAGTKVVAGVTPGKGGELVAQTPIYDSIEDAIDDKRRPNASIAFVPAAHIAVAAAEAIEAELEFVVLMVDAVPINTALEIMSMQRGSQTRVVGPNSPGIVSPGRCHVGALRQEAFMEGPVAVLSRSGGMMTTLCEYMTTTGIGQSTCIGVGGDSIIGTDLAEAALLAEADTDTQALCIFGEVGTSQEERLASFMRQGRITKPVFAYIAGVNAPPGRRYSHAGAHDVDGSSGGARKRRLLSDAGAFIVERYFELPAVIAANVLQPRES